MGYIQTKSPLPSADFATLAGKIRPMKTATIDGVVISNLARICFECALRKGELIGMSIGDVAKSGIVGNMMRIDGGDKEDELLPLSDFAKQVLQEHIQHLRSSGYIMYPMSPLFPAKRKVRYAKRNLQNHWKKICDACNIEVSLEQVRQGGICNHYNSLKAVGLPARECLKNTAEFARITERHAKDLFGDQIQPTGNKPNALYDYLGEIEKLEIASEKTGIDYTEANRILGQIKRDPGLNADEKEALESAMKTFIKKFKPKSHQSNVPVKKQTHRSLTELIKEFVSNSKD